MSLPDPVKGIAELLRSLIPYRREEYKQILELRLSESPPCQQRETRVRDRWTLWHTSVYVSHVDDSGTITIQ